MITLHHKSAQNTHLCLNVTFWVWRANSAVKNRNSQILRGYCLFVDSSRMIEIQTQMSERAVELLNLPEGQPCFLLDVG